jgi:uncharacterized protein
MDAQSDTHSDIRVPDLRTRTVIPFQVIQRLVSRIAERYQPQQIILFGTYAYGTPHPESDVDLLVIMDTPLREIQQMLEIRQFLNPLFGLDLIVYTPQNLAQRLAWGDSFLLEVIERGRVLYPSA